TITKLQALFSSTREMQSSPRDSLIVIILKHKTCILFIKTINIKFYDKVQINGAFGVDFAEWNENLEEYKENLTKVAKGLLKYGCTSFLPTLISSKPEIYRKILPLLEP